MIVTGFCKGVNPRMVEGVVVDDGSDKIATILRRVECVDVEDEPPVEEE